MNAQKCIACAAFCLTIAIVPTSANIWQMMETLIQKPFWQTLTSSYSTTVISIDCWDTVSIGQIFERDFFDVTIVYQMNVYKNLRQYYKLLTIVFNEALYRILSYFDRFIKMRDKNVITWDVNNHLWLLLRECEHIFSRIHGALLLLRDLYGSANHCEPQLENDFFVDIIDLLRLCDSDSNNVIPTLKPIVLRSLTLWEHNFRIAYWRNTAAVLNPPLTNAVQVARSCLSPKERLSRSKSFLASANRQFLDSFESIGFAYDETSSSTSFIQD